MDGMEKTMIRAYLFLIVLAGGVMLGCEPFSDPQEFERDEVLVFRAATVKPGAALKAPIHLQTVTWNIKYGGGRIPFWSDCWGDRVQMTRAEVRANLEGISDLINEINPDILMAQEVEYGNKRIIDYSLVRH